MKKRIILKSAAFASAAVLSPLLLNVSALGGLKDVAQPYLGTYECEQIFSAARNGRTISTISE